MLTRHVLCGIIVKRSAKAERNGGIAQLARATGSYPVGHGFKSNSRYHRPVGQAAKTPPFHGGNGSSILPRVTKKGTDEQSSSVPFLVTRVAIARYFCQRQKYGSSHLSPKPSGVLAHQRLGEKFSPQARFSVSLSRGIFAKGKNTGVQTGLPCKTCIKYFSAAKHRRFAGKNKVFGIFAAKTDGSLLTRDQTCEFSPQARFSVSLSRGIFTKLTVFFPLTPNILLRVPAAKNLPNLQGYL